MPHTKYFEQLVSRDKSLGLRDQAIDELTSERLKLFHIKLSILVDGLFLSRPCS